jgi:hypothetical protein
MRRRLNGLEGRTILKTALLSLVAALVMSAGLVIWVQTTAGQSIWIVVIGGILVGGGIYSVLLSVMRVEEVKLLTRAVMQRVRR